MELDSIFARMLRRTAHAILLTEARGYPAVVISGPRQSGKTTLAQAAFPEKPYVNFETPLEHQSFIDDPRGFFERYPDGAIIDEAQRCPELFSWLQEVLDTDGRMGLFILTGSQQFDLLSSVTQSLAGRVAYFELPPLSLAELRSEMLIPGNLYELILKGSYPAVYDRPVSPTSWYRNYVTTYVQRDVRSLLNVSNLSRFSSFISLCAAHCGSQVNYHKWAGQIGIDSKTIQSWLSVLEASYIIKLIKPHHTNFKKRIVKTPKLFFLDTGLLCYLLEITNESHIRTHPLRGALFENWCMAEILKARMNQQHIGGTYYWRSSDGIEVDILIEHGIHLQAIEIKANSTAKKELQSGIQKWLELAQETAFDGGHIIYTGNERRTLKGCTYVPWHEADSVIIDENT